MFLFITQVVHWSVEIQTKVHNPRKEGLTNWANDQASELALTLTSYFTFCKIVVKKQGQQLQEHRGRPPWSSPMKRKIDEVYRQDPEVTASELKNVLENELVCCFDSFCFFGGWYGVNFTFYNNWPDRNCGAAQKELIWISIFCIHFVCQKLKKKPHMILKTTINTLTELL